MRFLDCFVTLLVTQDLVTFSATEILTDVAAMAILGDILWKPSECKVLCDLPRCEGLHLGHSSVLV